MTFELKNADYKELVKTIPDNSAKLVFIDPPYTDGTKNALKHKIQTKIDIQHVVSESYRILQDGGFFVYFGMQPTLHAWNCLAYQIFNFKNEIIWCKRAAPMSLRINRMHETMMILVKGESDYYEYHEPYEDIKMPNAFFGLFNIESVFRELSFWKSKAKGNNPSDGSTYKYTKKVNEKIYEGFANMNTAHIGNEEVKLDTIWSFLPENKVNKNSNNHKHPTVKPLKLAKRLIKLCTLEGDLVVDFFSGTGTTLVACKELNRNFKGSEIDTEYFDDSLFRLSKVINQSKIDF